MGAAHHYVRHLETNKKPAAVTRLVLYLGCKRALAEVCLDREQDAGG
jgi:hypothetical protein